MKVAFTKGTLQSLFDDPDKNFTTVITKCRGTVAIDTQVVGSCDSLVSIDTDHFDD